MKIDKIDEIDNYIELRNQLKLMNVVKITKSYQKVGLKLIKMDMTQSTKIDQNNQFPLKSDNLDRNHETFDEIDQKDY